VTFLLSLYLQYIKALSPQQAGFVLVSQPVLMATIAPIAGRLSDRIEPRILSSTGMALTALGLLLLTGIGFHTSLYYIILCLVLLGSGFGFFSSPNTNAIMGSVERQHLGIASATVGTMRLTGQMISMGIATLILQLYLGNEPMSPDQASPFISSMRTTFLIFAALCFLGVFASLARGKARSHRKAHRLRPARRPARRGSWQRRVAVRHCGAGRRVRARLHLTAAGIGRALSEPRGLRHRLEPGSRCPAPRLRSQERDGGRNSGRG